MMNNSKALKRKTNDFLISFLVFLFLLSVLVLVVPPTEKIVVDFNNVEGGGSACLLYSNDTALDNYYVTNVQLIEDTEYPAILACEKSISKTVRFVISGVQSVRIEDFYIEVLGVPFSIVDDNEKEQSFAPGNYSTINWNKNSVLNVNTDTVIFLVNISYEKLMAMFLLYFFTLGSIALIITLVIRRFFSNCLNYRLLYMGFSSICVLLLGELLNLSVGYIGKTELVLNAAFVFSLCLFFSAIFDALVGCVVCNIIVSLLYVGNYFMLMFRGRPLLSWDLYAIDTAKAVIGSYDIKPNAVIILIALLLILQIAVIITYYRQPIRKHINKINRASFAIASIVLLSCTLSSSSFSEIKAYLWDTDIKYCYKENGVIASFVKYYLDNRMKEPVGYSAKRLNKICENYSINDTQINVNNRPDKIIIIMNESFSDMDQFNPELEVDDQPFLDSLKKQCVSGNLYVSVRGGGTCNTEFEALTGSSMAFFPFNSYPFVTYLHNNCFSLANFFANNQYEIASLHLENGENWGRERAYKYLSLYPFYTIDDYDNYPTVRDRATDEFDYSCLQAIDSDMEGEKKLIFNVTIQNHGGYTDPGGKSEIETYFDLIRLSDDALEKLIDYYSKDDKKVLILFFGDHQPVLQNEEEQIFVSSDNPLDHYKTEFFIWKNYEHKHKVYNISANYLPFILVEEANYPLPPYLLLLKNVYEEYPIITTQGIVDKNGKYYKSIDEIENILIDDYAIAVYNNIIDKNNNQELFYGNADF